jgi:hypothetical protein
MTASSNSLENTHTPHTHAHTDGMDNTSTGTFHTLYFYFLSSRNPHPASSRISVLLSALEMRGELPRQALRVVPHPRRPARQPVIVRSSRRWARRQRRCLLRRVLTTAVRRCRRRSVTRCRRRCGSRPIRRRRGGVVVSPTAVSASTATATAATTVRRTIGTR